MTSRPRRGGGTGPAASAPAEAGTVTAELALALPAVTLCLAALLGAGQVVLARLQCVDAARAAARVAARGEPSGQVAAVARRLGPSGAEVRVSGGTDRVVVLVSAPVRVVLPGAPAVRVDATAQADVEGMSAP